MAPTLYWFPLSPFARLVRYFLLASEIKHDLVIVDLIKGEQKGDAYKAINPQQKVPALVDGDLNLFESSAIIRYLASKYNSSLLPYNEGPEAVAKIDREVTLISNGLAKSTYLLVFEKVFKVKFGGTTDPATVAKLEGEIHSALTNANERYFQNSEFAVEDKLSLLDILLAIVFSQSKVVALDLSPFPNLNEFVLRISQQNTFQKAHAEFFATLKSFSE